MLPINNNNISDSYCNLKAKNFNGLEIRGSKVVFYAVFDYSCGGGDTRQNLFKYFNVELFKS